MQKIILCKGLPGSGKTTWAKQFCIDNPDHVRINKDDIRLLLGSPKYSKNVEDIVLDFERKLGLAILFLGKSLIVDDTNFSKIHSKYWRKIASDRHFSFIEKFFNTPLEECIQRDASRQKPVGESVILEMYEKHLKTHISST